MNIKYDSNDIDYYKMHTANSSITTVTLVKVKIVFWFKNKMKWTSDMKTAELDHHAWEQLAQVDGWFFTVDLIGQELNQSGN